MEIVVLDGYTLNPGDLDWQDMEKLGELTVYDRTAYRSGTEEDELIVHRASGASAVFTNKTPLSAAVLERLPNLRFIGVLATGYNIVDVKAARTRGITVTNIPTYGTTAVAQMTIALLLELCHHVGAHNEAVQGGEWTANPDWCFWKYPLVELAGKTLGVIGYGKIGRQAAKIARALGMEIIAVDKFCPPSGEEEGVRFVNLDELWAASDVISLHCPLFEDTREIINEKTIAAMKDGVFIVNTSRGQLVAEADLARALNRGKVGGAALDVVSEEPIAAHNPLLGAKNCILTPHISWAPRESRQRLMDIAVDNLSRYISGTPVNVVNE